MLAWVQLLCKNTEKNGRNVKNMPDGHELTLDVTDERKYGNAVMILQIGADVSEYRDVVISLAFAGPLSTTKITLFS